LLQLRLDFGVKVFEPLTAMADHGRTKRLKRLGADFDRSRNVQFDVRHNVDEKVAQPSSILVKLFTSGPLWQENLNTSFCLLSRRLVPL
jgi:hypothetical protein